MSTLTLTDAMTFLRITSTEDQAELQATIDAAESVIESRIGPLLNTAQTKLLARLGPMLEFSGRQLVSVTGITGGPIYGSPVVSVANVTVDPVGGVAYLPYTLLYCYQGPYTVSYTTGYGATAADVPDGLIQAVKELVRHMWTSQRGSGVSRPGPAPSDALPGSQYALPIRVEQLLAPYWPPGVG